VLARMSARRAERDRVTRPTGAQDTVLSPGRKKLILTICCMSLFIVGLDNTIVNLALPSIQRELHSSVSSLQWTTTPTRWSSPAC
jgi:hypothetical protein